MNQEKLYREAIKKWGVIAQTNMLIEECAELIVALAKSTRFHNGSTIPEIIEEMVDVEIMLEQFKIIVNDPDMSYSLFDIIKKRKLKRLESRLNE